MGWQGQLTLKYRHEGNRTLVHDRHHGPLRTLQSLYPEGPGICHNVLLHPPGGVVGGDVLEIDADLGANCHALITTPGATRFYRSAGEPATQSINARLAASARLEWLPLETIVHSGALAHNHLRFDLAPGAEMIGWDVLALGLPAANEPFVNGSFQQQIELPGVWLERGRIDASDHGLLDSPLGWAGNRMLATLWFAAGSALPGSRREGLLETARECIAAHALAGSAGATAPQAELVVMRVLAPRVEAAMQLLTDVRAAWRHIAWGLEAQPPRIWRQ